MNPAQFKTLIHIASKMKHVLLPFTLKGISAYHYPYFLF